MEIRERLISKIEKIPECLLIELEQYLDQLIENNDIQDKRRSITRNHLEKLKSKSSYENIDTIKIAKSLKNEWEIVKEDQVLTNFVIDIIHEFMNPQSETFAAKRINGDSRTGGFFEDNFGFLLNSYLRSKQDLWSQDNKFNEIEITLNQPIAVPGERRKRKPDVLIMDTGNGIPICILELKSSFTKRSLVKPYNSNYEMWKGLNENIKFYYIIFRSSSENKTRTYKKVEGCRVICYDFKTDRDSEVKGITPTIVDPIENIFEEIYQAIIEFKTGY